MAGSKGWAAESAPSGEVSETVPARTADQTEQPRWLDDDERAAWLATVALMSSLPGALDAHMQRSAGLTFFEYMVLAMLSEQPDRTLRMSDLAQAAASSLPRLSHVVGRLERRGYVTRSRIPGPGRRTNTTLTETGWATVEATAPGHVAAVRHLFIDALSRDELAALRRIGAHVAAAVESEGGQPCSSPAN